MPVVPLTNPLRFTEMIAAAVDDDRYFHVTHCLIFNDVTGGAADYDVTWVDYDGNIVLDAESATNIGPVMVNINGPIHGFKVTGSAIDANNEMFIYIK